MNWNNETKANTTINLLHSCDFIGFSLHISQVYGKFWGFIDWCKWFNQWTRWDVHTDLQCVCEAWCGSGRKQQELLVSYLRLCLFDVVLLCLWIVSCTFCNEFHKISLPGPWSMVHGPCAILLHSHQIELIDVFFFIHIHNSHPPTPPVCWHRQSIICLIMSLNRSRIFLSLWFHFFW